MSIESFVAGTQVIDDYEQRRLIDKHITRCSRPAASSGFPIRRRTTSDAVRRFRTGRGGPATADAGNAALGDGALDLGPLKGNVGNQNYVVPAGTDLSRYRSVVIWCRRFAVPFGAAPLPT